MALLMLLRKPDWFKVPLADPKGLRTQRILNNFELNTVCHQAHCPNLGRCYNQGTATFLILGDICTRNCKFCAVKTGSPDPPDPAEPLRVAQAVQRLKLRHCVITGVNRDDLPASGAEFYARTVELVREFNPEVKVEVLTGDFSGEKRALKMVLDVSPEVFNHNLETVERLTPVVRDRRANYRVSLEMLESAKNYRPEIFTKSGLILGMGEDFKEIIRTLRDLREVGCDGLTLGQYLPPSKKHYPVKKYYQPEEFEELEDQARRMGFKGVAAGPLVRSSFRAGEMYEEEFMKRMEE